jgi:hypothetical protein
MTPRQRQAAAALWHALESSNTALITDQNGDIFLVDVETNEHITLEAAFIELQTGGLTHV